NGGCQAWTWDQSTETLDPRPSYPDNPPVPLGPYPPRPAAYSWSDKTIPGPLPASDRATYFAPDNSVRHPKVRFAGGSDINPRCQTHRARFSLTNKPCHTLQKNKNPAM